MDRVPASRSSKAFCVGDNSAFGGTTGPEVVVVVGVVAVVGLTPGTILPDESSYTPNIFSSTAVSVGFADNPNAILSGVVILGAKTDDNF